MSTRSTTVSYTHLDVYKRQRYSNKEKLIACHHTVDEICEIAGADSLEFLSMENLYKIAPDAHCGFCDGCFTEHYPLEIPQSHLDAPVTTCG